MTIEMRRGIELRARDDGSVEGTVVKYGDIAIVHGQPERFEPGSLVMKAPALFYHHRGQKIASEVALIDTAAALDFRAQLDPRFVQPIRQSIQAGLLTGASIEFRALKERLEAGVRVIERATIEGLALVDVPAYPGSSGLQMRRVDDTAAFGQLEYRQATGVIAGRILLGVPGITSLARKKKLMIAKDADIMMADDIFLLDGYDYGKAIASTKAGSLEVVRKAGEIAFRTVNRKLARTPALRELRAKMRAGLVNGVVPGVQRPDNVIRLQGGSITLPEFKQAIAYTEIDEDGFEVTTLRQTALCELNTTARSGDDYSGSVYYAVTNRLSPAARRRRRGL